MQRRRWYHNKLPGKKPADLPAFVQGVERFAMGEYAQALQAGAGLPAKQKLDIAGKLHAITGLPVWYIVKANLRIDGGEFEKTLQDDAGLTTGRLDTRFSGFTLDPLSEKSDYDPQSASISSAYISGFNAYVRQTLNYGQGKLYVPSARLNRDWDMRHKPPGQQFPGRGAANVMPDLANAMKQNPNLKILLMGGYYDLATPYYEGWYEMHQLPIPDSLQKNIQYHYYQSRQHGVRAPGFVEGDARRDRLVHQLDEQCEVTPTLPQGEGGCPSRNRSDDAPGTPD